MRFASFVVLALVTSVAACGKEIGDECILASDCSPNGDRQCDTVSAGGYCTVAGCDFNTCPEEAACIRFFTGHFENKPCTQRSECSLDELCSLEGHCVPRSSEIRFCMRTCESDDDCRGGYHCRDLDRMRAYGGEPVLAGGASPVESSPRFCAEAPPTE